jgi:hypothetical protein
MDNRQARPQINNKIEIVGDKSPAIARLGGRL